MKCDGCGRTNSILAIRCKGCRTKTPTWDVLLVTLGTLLAVLLLLFYEAVTAAGPRARP